MKIFKSNRVLYFILPVIITSIILLYMAFLFRNSYTWVNVANIALDVIILIYYLIKFLLEIRVSEKEVMLKTMFKKYTVYREQVKGVVYTSFIIRIVTENNSFYLLTSSRERAALKGLLKDFSKMD